MGTRSQRSGGVEPDALEGGRRGEPEAVARFCERWIDRVYRWTVFLGLPRADAEDVTQRVLLIAVAKLPGTGWGSDACESERLAGWMYQITRRTIANHRRSSWWRRWWQSPEPIEPTFAERGHADVELETSVREALGQLPAALVEVLVLSDLEDRSRSEVAVMLGIAEGTVASRLRAARAAFRAVWRGEDGAS
jgi:RNA polymerase sigma-70 factor (ECF subfamily)